MQYFLLVIGLIILDAVTKVFAYNNFQTELELIQGFFSLSYVENTGIAFSIPITGIFLKILTLILIICIILYYLREERLKKSVLLDISYMFIIAGALGNAWERIFKGYVTDFLALEHFAVFNLADSYITIGALGVIVYYTFYESRTNKNYSLNKR